MSKSVIGRMVDDGYKLKEFAPILTGGRIGIWQDSKGEIRLSMHTGGFTMLFEATTAHMVEEEFRLTMEEKEQANRERFREMSMNQYSEVMYSNNK